MSPSVVIRWTRAIALSAAVLGCGTNSASAGLDGGNLVIQTESSVAASVINYGGAGLEATLHNNSSQTLYANVGDAFNAAEEQDPLLTSSGSDAVVEGENSYGVWSALEQGVMVEGTKYVAIKPGKTYRLLSVVAAPSFRGQARIRVRYSTTPNATGTIAVDYSNVFEVR